MKFTQKYTIICLLEELEEGYDFSSSNWPLHVTLADTFAIDWDVERLKVKLQHLAKSTVAFGSVATAEEYFGPEKETHVVIIKKTKELEILHEKIIDALKNAKVVFNDPQFTEEGFLPHSTIQKHARVHLGQNVNFANLTLIDMYPDEDPYRRRILKITKFK